MYNLNTVDISTARREFSRILDKVFFDRQIYVIMKRNIPIVKMIKADETMVKTIKTKLLDTSLFGIWKDKKAKTTTIAYNLRKKSWVRK